MTQSSFLVLLYSTVFFSYLLLLDLGLDHAVFCRRRLLICYQLLCVAQPAEEGLQSILELPTMQQGLLQLGDPLRHLRTGEMVVSNQSDVQSQT